MSHPYTYTERDRRSYIVRGCRRPTAACVACCRIVSFTGDVTAQCDIAPTMRHFMRLDARPQRPLEATAFSNAIYRLVLGGGLLDCLERSGAPANV